MVFIQTENELLPLRFAVHNNRTLQNKIENAHKGIGSYEAAAHYPRHEKMPTDVLMSSIVV